MAPNFSFIFRPALYFSAHYESLSYLTLLKFFILLFLCIKKKKKKAVKNLVTIVHEKESIIKYFIFYKEKIIFKEKTGFSHTVIK